MYVEIDYFDVVSKKIQIIKAKLELTRHLKPIIEETQHLLNTSNYKIISGDLRDTVALAEKLNHTSVDPNSPTLLLSECVLVYLKPEESKSILTFFKDHFKGDLALVNYEMINPNDPFGRTMLENLEVTVFLLNLCIGSRLPSTGNK